MSRISQLSDSAANPQQLQLFAAVRDQLGLVPNFIRVFGHSTAALQGFLGLFHITQAGELDGQTKERIALALAEQNSCEYCLSAHASLAGNAGLSDEEITASRLGESEDAKAQAALSFARALAQNTGDISNSQLLAVREAGHSDAEIVEIISHVALNLLTNMLGKASQVAVDFPKVSPGSFDSN